LRDPLCAQTGATFGDVIGLGGTPSDIVLDESRKRLYLVNANANRVDVWDYNAQALAGSIAVGLQPLAAAMSMDGALLYVTNNGSSSLSVIDLNSGFRLAAQHSLAARETEGSKSDSTAAC
jgi:DNA-binding beta-propeller fold protein YncE